MRTITDKEKFIRDFQIRIRAFVVEIIGLCENLKKGKASEVISYQIIKSASSTGANYRAVCKARSKAEFFSKICIVAEEADETVYWLEIIIDSGLCSETDRIKKLYNEAIEISKIISKAKETSFPK